WRKPEGSERQVNEPNSSFTSVQPFPTSISTRCCCILTRSQWRKRPCNSTLALDETSYAARSAKSTRGRLFAPLLRPSVQPDLGSTAAIGNVAWVPRFLLLRRSS
ncbi:hypothetical protein JG687_00015003, partial [Phytophthora cactorum]